MIDVHTHVLPFVDDGSDSLEKSLALVREEVSIGVTDVICTPHLRNNFRLTKEEVVSVFDDFKNQVDKEGINVKLHLGRELYASKHYKTNVSKFGALMPDGKSVLIEFDFGFECEICETVYELVKAGYTPIVAHPERYPYMTIDDALEVKNMGGRLQVNADSVTALSLTKRKRFVNKLFSENLVDFVASDIHFGRKNLLKKAYNLVCHKYGKDTAEKVFKGNAKKIIEG